MDLDQLLNEATPPVAPRTVDLERDLHELVIGTEAAQAKRRRPARVVLAGGAVAGVLGLGAAASAAGVLPGWPSFSTSSGQSCAIEISVQKLHPGDGEPNNTPRFSAEEQDRTLAAAHKYLGHFDYQALDRGRAITWWRAQERKARAAQPDPRERQPRLRGDDLEVTAVSTWVIDHLRTDLANQGLDIRAVEVSTSTTGCTL